MPCLHPRHEGPGIRLSRPKPTQPGEHVPEHLQHAPGTVALLLTGRHDHHGEDQPERIAAEMTLAAVALWVRIAVEAPPLPGL
jgi:hypothetical protein